MTRTLRPIRVWRHELCGHEVSDVELVPVACPKCGADPARFDDMGYRVGEAQVNYSWYSTYDRALTDKRTKP